MQDFAEGYTRSLLDLTTEIGHLEGYPFAYPSLLLGLKHLELECTSDMVNDAFAKLFEVSKRNLRLKSLSVKGHINRNFEELVRTICGTLRLHELAIDIKYDKSMVKPSYEFEEEKSKMFD